MTIQDARKQINDAESKVANAFSDMKNSAYNMAEAAESEAHSNTAAVKVLPLIACLIGVFCCFAGSWLGIFLIIVGAVVAYNMHGSAKVGENKISGLTKELSNQLDKYSKI